MWRDVEAKWGNPIHLDLPDGSKVWLNRGAEVHFADGFTNGKRELTLDGEAFIDVKNDPDLPFIIHAGGIDLKASGATLNIRSYPLDGGTVTTLIKGKAEMLVPFKRILPIPLRPGEKVMISSDAAGVERGCPGVGVSEGYREMKRSEPTPYQRYPVTVDPTYKTMIETAWMEDKLVFREQSFRETVVRMLERWYDVNFYFKNDEYYDKVCSGYFKDQPLKTVLDSLQHSLGFHYRIAGDSVIIK